MRTIMSALAVASVLAAGLPAARMTEQKPETGSEPRSRRLPDLSWVEAESLLTPETIVVVPLGAGSKEHGPHLKLKNDLVLAEHLASRTAAATAVIVAPPLTYHYYPAFLEYPGSTSLALGTARDLTVDVVRSLGRYGPRRFYVLNTGISTQPALSQAAQVLAAEGILLRFTSFSTQLAQASRGLLDQEGGSHADEVETSLMLHLEPSIVDMQKAVKDYSPRSTPFVLTRRKDAAGTYSPTGIWGDPTRATAEKGRVIAEAIVAEIVREIEALRSARLPEATERPVEQAPPQPGRESPQRPESAPACTAGDVRTIRGLADMFTAFWANADAERLGGLWTESGDIVHPDESVERTSEVITQNRRELFKRREYRLSRHPMLVGNVRCLTPNIGVADGRWELKGLVDANGKILPSMKGLFTMVVERSAPAWRIAAYRYTIDPADPTVPTLLKRPGYPGGV